MSSTPRFRPAEGRWWMVALVAIACTCVLLPTVCAPSTRASFRRAAEAIHGRATHHLLSAGSGFSDLSFVNGLSAIEGVTAIRAVVETTVRVPDAGNEPLRIRSFDPANDGFFEISRRQTTMTTQPLVLSTTTGTSVLLPENFARRRGIVIGQVLEVIADDQAIPLKVCGTYSSEAMRRSWDDVALLEFPDSMRIFGKANRLELVLAGDSEGSVAARIPNGTVLCPTPLRGEFVKAMARALDVHLNWLSMLGFLAGCILTLAALGFHGSGLLQSFRASIPFGFTREQAIRVCMVDGAFVAFAGTTFGLVLTALSSFVIYAAHGRGELLLSTRPDWIHLLNGILSLPFVIVFFSFLVGTCTWRIAVQPDNGERSLRAFSRTVCVVALLVAATGLVVFLPVSLSASAAVVGFVLMATVLIIPLGNCILSAIVAPVRGLVGGALPAIPIRNLATLHRTTIGFIALVLILVLSSSLKFVVESFQERSDAWLQHTFPSDIRVDGADAARPLVPQVFVSRMRHHEVTAQSFAVTRCATAVRDVPVIVEAWQTGKDGAPPLLWFLAGNGTRVFGPNSDPHACLLSRSAVQAVGAELGTGISVDSPSGPLTLSVAGIFEDPVAELPRIIVSAATHAASWDSTECDSAFISLHSDFVPDRLLMRIRNTRASLYGILATSHAGLRRDAGLIVTRATRCLTTSVTAMTTLAALGSSLMLLLSFLRRKRDIRCMLVGGVSAGQLLTLALLEAALLSVAAGTVLAGANAICAMLFGHMLDSQAVSWNPMPRLPEFRIVAPILGAFATLVVPALCAGLCLRRFDAAKRGSLPPPTCHR